MNDKLSKPPGGGTPPVAAKLLKLAVVDGATQLNVIGAKNWAALKNASASVTVEATTAPANSPDEWKQIKWTGGGTAVAGKLNRRTIPLSASKQFHIEAALGCVTDSVDIWVLWATIEVRTKGKRPGLSRPFPGSIKERSSDDLGVIIYNTGLYAVLDDREGEGEVVEIRATAGKVAIIASLTPQNVNKVVREGWKIEREAFSRIWRDGVPDKQTNTVFTRDTSDPSLLQLIPNVLDEIYDIDGPDSKSGEFTFERYDNFRQWVEWNGKKCSEMALWSWQAIWRINKDPAKQIELHKLDKGKINLPTSPKYPPHPPKP